MENRFIGIFGIFAILFLAYLLSNNKKNIDKKLVIWGISLQIFFALLINFKNTIWKKII